METSGWIGVAILVTFVVVYLYLTIRRRMPTLDRPEDRASLSSLADVEQNRAQNSSSWSGGGDAGLS